MASSPWRMPWGNLPYRPERVSVVQEYDRKLKEARLKGKRRFNVHETVDGRQIEHSIASVPPTGASLGRDASTASIASSSNYQMPEASGAGPVVARHPPHVQL